ncbi:flagellar brake protein [Euzebya sp.]|uniref:flagellar brake protein n=1 Tax=Euzebya sp. TaxID=1971409 RepID=UPI00351765BA
MSDAGARWPAAGSLVELSWRVQTFDASVLLAEDEELICTPCPRAGLLVPHAPVEAMVRWTDADGAYTRPATMVLADGGHVRLEASGTTCRTQRRAYVRAPVAVEIVVEDLESERPGVAFAFDADEHATSGWTSDLSEGGARVFLDGPPPPQGAHVAVRLVVDGEAVDARAQVTRISEGPDRCEVGLTFEQLAPSDADVIRRQVFTAQVEARRNGVLR